jgi:hypothetical protein
VSPQAQRQQINQPEQKPPKLWTTIILSSFRGKVDYFRYLLLQQKANTSSIKDVVIKCAQWCIIDLWLILAGKHKEHVITFLSQLGLMNDGVSSSLNTKCTHTHTISKDQKLTHEQASWSYANCYEYYWYSAEVLFYLIPHFKQNISSFFSLDTIQLHCGRVYLLPITSLSYNRLNFFNTETQIYYLYHAPITIHAVSSHGTAILHNHLGSLCPSILHSERRKDMEDSVCKREKFFITQAEKHCFVCYRKTWLA